MPNTDWKKIAEKLETMLESKESYCGECESYIPDYSCGKAGDSCAKEWFCSRTWIDWAKDEIQNEKANKNADV